jgi:Ca2+/H+ antiporter
MAKHYIPPTQSGFWQLVDSLFLLVLVYLSLLAPLLLKTPEVAPASEAPQKQVSWRELGQNSTMEAQWKKLGYDTKTAKSIITTKFDYAVEPVSLGVTIAVILAYFTFMLIASKKQYRDVIAERFGDSDRK